MDTQKNQPSYHDCIIGALQEQFPELQAKGLGAGMRERFANFSAVFKHQRFIPDLFSFNDDLRELTVFEVEHFKPLDIVRLRKMEDLAWFLDDQYWSLNLMVVNRHCAVAGYNIIEEAVKEAAGRKPTLFDLYATQ